MICIRKKRLKVITQYSGSNQGAPGPGWGRGSSGRAGACCINLWHNWLKPRRHRGLELWRLHVVDGIGQTERYLQGFFTVLKYFRNFESTYSGGHCRRTRHRLATVWYGLHGALPWAASVKQHRLWQELGVEVYWRFSGRAKSSAYFPWTDWWALLQIEKSKTTYSDENVLFYHTTELIDSLTAACKPYDFKPLVQERHGLRSSSSINYYEMTVLNYLERNL